MLYLVVIPACIAFVPWLLARYVCKTEHSQVVAYRKYAPYLWLAAALWIAAFFVPNIPISDETQTFGQHFVGGMVATVLLGYVTRVYDLRFARWWQWCGVVYLWASGLGVANELFELALTKLGLMAIESSDVWWDLLANTLGAFGAFVLFVLYKRFHR